MKKACAQSIKIGKTIGGSGFHIPSYIAVDKGMLKAEGLNADFISAGAGVLVRAGIAKEIEFVPIPGGGAEAMLKGAPLAFIVGESLVSQWAIVTQPEFKRVEELKGKTIGLERPGQAAYTEAVVVLGKFFKMEPGKDYKVITFNAETDRVAALINKSIDAALLSFPHGANHGANVIDGVSVAAQKRRHADIAPHLHDIRGDVFLAKKAALLGNVKINRRDAATGVSDNDFVDRRLSIGGHDNDWKEKNGEQQRWCFHRNLRDQALDAAWFDVKFTMRVFARLPLDALR